ncbi:alpha/beta-hydrolase [Hypoxylon sp. FL1150]|nr:alpha/beta-hydrolase [Hypoxylon sp. FL1150]
MSQHSEACCRIPPIMDDNYQPKGTYIELNSTKTYVTGPADAERAILSGADILADSDADRKYQYPPTDDEKKTKLGKWFESSARGFLEAAQKNNPKINSWGIIGYGWGGKMASVLACDEEPLFKVAVHTSPAMIDAGDGANVKISVMLLASKDESAEEVKAYGDSLKVPKHVGVFDDQVHGFMSARADLKDAQVKAQYERGYKLSLEFFHRHL